MSEESKLNHDLNIVCPIDNKSCAQHENITSIRDILSSHDDEFEKFKKVSRDVEILNTNQSKLEITVNSLAESVDKVWQMYHADQRLNLTEHGDFKVDIIKLDGKIERVESKSNIENMKQNQNITNKELNGYKEIEKTKNGLKIDIFKTILVGLATWTTLMITGLLNGFVEVAKKFF